MKKKKIIILMMIIHMVLNLKIKERLKIKTIKNKMIVKNIRKKKKP